MNMTVFSGNNDQELTITGLVDQAGAFVSGAVITGTLVRGGLPLSGGTVAFTDVAGQPGTYMGMLAGFDSPAGGAQLKIVGTHGDSSFGFTTYCAVATRSL